MKIDITLKISPAMVKTAQENEKRVLVGHLGTHIDIMDKTFPLDYLEKEGIIFDVSDYNGQEINLTKEELNKIDENMFVLFYTGFIDKEEYGSPNYFKNHPELNDELIDNLIAKKVALIGIDCAGIKRGAKHPLTDQKLADKNIFVVENLCNLNEVLKLKQSFKVNTYPMNYINISGIPCRVIVSDK